MKIRQLLWLAATGSLVATAALLTGPAAFGASTGQPGSASAATPAEPNAAVAAYQTAVPAAAQKVGAANRLTEWYQKDGTTYIGLSTVTGQDAATFQSALGSSRVQIFQQDQAHTMDLAIPASDPKIVLHGNSSSKSGNAVSPLTLTPNGNPPFNDSEPYYGGDRIASYQTINGTDYAVECTTTGQWASGEMTAGHCGANGTLWYQGYYDASAGTIYGSGVMGTTTQHHFSNNDIDGAILTGGSYDHWVWEATQSTYSAHLVVGGAQAQVGTSVCTAGSTTGYTCSGTVTVLNACVNLDDDGTIVHVCGLDEAQNSSKVLVAAGDSGGPVLTNNSSGVLINGTISGGTTDGHTVYYTDYTQQRTTFGYPVTG